MIIYHSWIKCKVQCPRRKEQLFILDTFVKYSNSTQTNMIYTIDDIYWIATCYGQ